MKKFDSEELRSDRAQSDLIKDLLADHSSRTLHLVRHGETDWNARQLFQGQKNISLNELGRAQAERIGNRLQNVPLAVIYTSGLKRAQETAQRITEYHELKVISDPRLNEISFGDWEGMDYQTIEDRFPDLLDRWFQKPLNTSAPGGESLLELSHRVRKSLQEIIPAPAEGDILLVAHGGPLQSLICTLLNFPLENYWQFHLDNASLTTLTIYPEGTVLNLLNDTCHLEGLNEG
jgi:alpha-ribazole phosphatase